MDWATGWVSFIRRILLCTILLHEVFDSLRPAELVGFDFWADNCNGFYFVMS